MCKFQAKFFWLCTSKHDFQSRHEETALGLLLQIHSFTFILIGGRRFDEELWRGAAMFGVCQLKRLYVSDTCTSEEINMNPCLGQRQWSARRWILLWVIDSFKDQSIVCSPKSTDLLLLQNRVDQLCMFCPEDKKSFSQFLCHRKKQVRKGATLFPHSEPPPLLDWREGEVLRICPALL